MNAPLTNEQFYGDVVVLRTLLYVRLKRLVADLSLEKQILKDVAAGNL
jgi:hypothetical protein